MKFPPMSAQENLICKQYYSLFYKAVFKVSKRKFGIKKFDLNNPMCDGYYHSALDSYIYSIKKFKYINMLGNPEYERKFINFIYSNITFFIYNYINKDKEKNVTSIESSEEFVSYIDSIHHTTKHQNFVENFIDTQYKIKKFLNDSEILKIINKKKLSISQVSYILQSIFNKENYKYLYEMTSGKKLVSKLFSNFLYSVYEKYLESDIDKTNFKHTKFKTWKMKIYPILKEFLRYEIPKQKITKRIKLKAHLKK